MCSVMLRLCWYKPKSLLPSPQAGGTHGLVIGDFFRPAVARTLAQHVAGAVDACPRQNALGNLTLTLASLIHPLRTTASAASLRTSAHPLA